MTVQNLRKKKYGIGMAAIMLVGLTACENQKTDDNLSAGKDNEQTETIENSSLDSEADTTEIERNTEDMEETVSVMTETVEKEISSVTDDESMKAAYVSILEEIYYNHTFPDGEDYGFFDSSHISDNKFAVCDIDQDGKDELIIQYTTTYMAGMVELIYDYDKESDTVRTELVEFPAIIFYDNGVIEAGLSHNQGLAGDFWPYNLYQYEPDSDAYIMVGMIDAWDMSYAEKDFNGNPFPEEIDADGDGIVYYIITDGTYGTPVDLEEYNQWRRSYVGEAKEVDVPYLNLTAENIESIK